jgi:Ni/Fe-hydrogenase b-type cytochrome subunit
MSTGRGTVKVVRSRRPEIAEGTYQWMYLWGLPIRISHWVAVFTILILAATGFYIGRPFFSGGGPAHRGPLPDGLDAVHPLRGGGGARGCGHLRVYWLFFGNRYERWEALFPIQKRDWVNTWRMVKAYTLVRPEKAPHYLGHNPLQQMNYTLIYAVGLFQIVTGFGLYGLANPGGFFASALGWVGPLFGGWQVVRLLHHAALWVCIIFLPLHVYLVLRSAMLDRAGTLSSIFTGGRFLREGVTFEDVD